MMTVLVKKPLSVLDKKIKISWKDAFKSMGKAVLHFATGKMPEFSVDLIELASSVGVEPDAGDVAWLLIRRSLTKAFFDLIRDHRELFSIDTPSEQKISLAEAGLDFESGDLSDVVLEINDSFFRNPQSLELLREIHRPLVNWLETYGMKPIAAHAVAERIGPYFTFALHEEWARASSDYAKLREHLDTPFTKASDVEHAWFRYQSYLWRIVNEPMFAEAFGLIKIYISLRAYWEERASDYASNAEGQKYHVVDLKECLDVWLDANNSEDSIRVISGGPGSGKSSFTRVYAAETITKGKVRVLYIPLHLFDPKGDLISSVGDFVRAGRFFTVNPLDVNPADKPRRLLIIFDGLDELAMQGKLAAETAQQFVREVEKNLSRLNQMTPWLSVIISGREVVVQANATEFRKPKQILHILPYAINLKSSELPEDQYRIRFLRDEKSKWEDPGGLLDLDQRAEWWAKYSRATGMHPEQIPPLFCQGELNEITSQPLLVYLVALSFARGKIQLESETNLNEIYADLIDAVWERAYERSRKFQGVQNLTKSEFVRVLEEIGLAAWHDERRTTTVKAIREHFSNASLDRILSKFQEGAEVGVTRLLAAFYFRQHGELDGDKTFEFTHKSFGEYLASCRIVRTLENLRLDSEEHEQNPDRGKSTPQILASWTQVCGPSSLDQYYDRFLSREIVRFDLDRVKSWQKMLADLISSAARTNIPMERVEPRPTTFVEEVRFARNAAEALFVCAAACGDRTKSITAVEWYRTDAASSLFKFINGGNFRSVFRRSMRNMNLSRCVFNACDLFGYNFDKSDLSSVRFQFVMAVGCSFSGTKMLGAAFMESDFSHSIFESAELTGASFSHCQIYRTMFSNIDMLNVSLLNTRSEDTIFTAVINLPEKIKNASKNGKRRRRRKSTLERTNRPKEVGEPDWRTRVTSCGR